MGFASQPRAGVIATIILLTAIMPGCRWFASDRFPPCPEGTRLMGAPPPKGSEMWCARTRNGKSIKDGPFVVFDMNGTKIIQGFYSDGIQSGKWTMWYDTGQRSAVDHYIAGQQEGLHTSWYANGAKAIEGYYRGGKREGVWHRWDPNGLTVWSDVYKDDVRVSSIGRSTLLPPNPSRQGQAN